MRGAKQLAEKAPELDSDNSSIRIVGAAYYAAVSNVTNTSSFQLFSTASTTRQRWFEALERKDVVQKLLQESNSHAISNAIWSRATLGLKGSSLASAIDTKEVVEKMATEWTPKNISNTVWALATMGIDARNVIRYIDDDAERIVAEAQPQDISNISYAFATLGERSATRWFEQLEREDVVQKVRASKERK